jgi:hypothetical protein
MALIRLGAVGALAFAIGLGAAGAAEKTMDELKIPRGTSPWQGYTGSYDEEQAGLKVRAVKILPEHERVAHLAAYVSDGEPLLAIDRKARRVVVNERCFGDVQRPDATRLRQGERAAVGVVKCAGLRKKPRELVRFLIESELVKTYVHTEANLRIVDEKTEGTRYRARCKGSHVFYTNERNESPLDFTVEIDSGSGAISVAGS